MRCESKRACTQDRLGVRGVVFALAVLLCAVLLGSQGAAAQASAGEESAPAKVIRETADAVIAVLARTDLSAEQKRREIEKIVEKSFDFTTLSRLVLARNWNTLNPEQQQRFVTELKRHLSLTYGRNIETYHNERVVITGEREEARGDRIVKTRITRPNGQDIPVDYRLRERDGAWRVIDVVIDGVSLVANYRSQFQSIISRDGPAKLIDLLHEKNERGEVFDQGQPAGAR
jgi:phospholipid transport system substrate-binding protein